MDYSKLSFILVKEDSLKNDDIMEKIQREMMLHNMVLENSFNAILNEEQVDCMWPLRMYDFVSNYLLKRFMSNKVMPVYVFKGNDALKKTTLIKKNVRKQYQRSRYANCVHTPSSEEECKLHLLCLQNKYKTGDMIAPHPNRLTKFPEINMSRLKQCAENLFIKMQDINFDSEKNKILQQAKNYYVFLEIDYKHMLNEVVSVLYENLRGYRYSIEDSYLIAFGVEQLGSYPIFCHDVYENALAIYQKLSLVGLKLNICSSLDSQKFSKKITLSK